MTGTIRYGDWTPDRHGWFLGLSAGQWATVLAGGLPALVGAGSHRWLFALAWLPVWVVLSLLAVMPVRGRPAARWLVDAILHAIGAVTGWANFQSKVATGHADDLAEADLPGVLAGIRVHDGPPTGPHLRRPAIVQDCANRTWAVVARISHPGIGLTEPGERARMAAGLSELLEAVAAAELVSTAALQVRAVPDDGAERAAWQRRNLRADAPDVALSVTTDLADLVARTGVRHEVFLTLVVPEQRLGRQASDAGSGVDGRARVLYGAMAEVEAHLLGPVGCGAVEWLDSPRLAAAIRTGFAPGERASLIGAEPDGRDDAASALPIAAAGPSSAPAPERRCYVHDAWATVTCAVLLPDQGAIMGALAPVFTPTQTNERRSVTVFYEPMPRRRADRLVGRDSMSAGTAAEMRARLGFRSRAAHRRDAARVEGQDVRLAEGRALVRVAVVAAVTVPSFWSVLDHGRRLESSIRASGFTPLRLDLAQDSGFAAACVPLGVALPRQRRRG
ncbi:MAG: hypothetical protein EPN43_10850 [Jatrophihabitans sp.]|nr:MAG: hypothetical protein EPN43_10850 [Jatrophihabitans sp.]